MSRSYNNQLRLPSDEVLTEFLTLLKQGHYVKTACDYTGLKEGQVYAWMREANREDAREWVQNFAQSVKNARAYAQAAALQVVTRAANNGTWQAAAWFLERSNPQQWALRTRHEIDLHVETEEPVPPRKRLGQVLEVLGQELAQENAVVLELTHDPDYLHASNGD